MNNQLSDVSQESKIDCLQKIIQDLDIEKIDDFYDEFEGKSHKILKIALKHNKRLRDMLFSL